MSEIAREWAEQQGDNEKLRLKGLVIKSFDFWDQFKKSLEEYAAALDKVSGQPVLSITSDDTETLRLVGPVIELSFLVDRLTQTIYYSFTSPKLAHLWKATSVPSLHGKISIHRKSFYSSLACTPNLFFDHFGNPMNLDEIPDEWKRSWPIHDVAARYFVEKTLDAKTVENLKS